MGKVSKASCGGRPPLDCRRWTIHESLCGYSLLPMIVTIGTGFHAKEAIFR
jgi:hypothetical protein